jgi:hypothetical protein
MVRTRLIAFDGPKQSIKPSLVPCQISSGRPPFREADMAPYTPDVPGEMSKLSWIELLKFGMVWVRAAPSLWSSRPAVGLIRAETV